MQGVRVSRHGRAVRRYRGMRTRYMQPMAVHVIRRRTGFSATPRFRRAGLSDLPRQSRRAPGSVPTFGHNLSSRRRAPGSVPTLGHNLSSRRRAPGSVPTFGHNLSSRRRAPGSVPTFGHNLSSRRRVCTRRSWMASSLSRLKMPMVST